MSYQANVAEAIKAPTGGNYINTSGVYDVTIKAVIVDYSDKGDRNLNFYVEHNGQDQVIYGAIALDANKDGNYFQRPAFDQLLVITDNLSLGDPEEATLPIGKGGIDKDVAIYPELCDLDVKMWIRQEFYINKEGSIKEKKLVKGFYSVDGSSADEITNGTESGVRFNKDSKYHSTIAYGKDGLTAEIIADWVAAGRPEKSMASGASAKTAAPKPSFGKPKFGAK